VLRAGGVGLAGERAHERGVRDVGDHIHLLPGLDVRAHAHDQLGVALEAFVGRHRGNLSAQRTPMCEQLL
jgi:hypothetical protein